MKNKIKYQKTEDAVRAYKSYAAHHFSPCSFETWVNVDDGITPAPKEDGSKTKDDWIKSGLSFGTIGGLGLYHLANSIKNLIGNDPWLLAKSMQGSTNPEVREYGYRMELAIEKERQAKKVANGETNGVEITK